MAGDRPSDVTSTLQEFVPIFLNVGRSGSRDHRRASSVFAVRLEAALDVARRRWLRLEVWLAASALATIESGTKESKVPDRWRSVRALTSCRGTHEPCTEASDEAKMGRQGVGLAHGETVQRQKRMAPSVAEDGTVITERTMLPIASYQASTRCPTTMTPSSRCSVIILLPQAGPGARRPPSVGRRTEKEWRRKGRKTK